MKALFTLICCCAFSMAKAQAPYFPTGMTWEERMMDYHGDYAEWGPVETFEIGPDTIVNGQVYKQVFRDGELEPVCVREQDNVVWLLTDVNQQEIKLYDFNWESQQEITTQYLKYLYEEETHQLCTETFQTKNVATTYLGGTEVRYYREDFGRTTIWGIGDVIDLRRFGNFSHPHDCLLGFCMPQYILPGLTYKKVISIQRNGVEIYRSENYDEWIHTIPNAIQSPQTNKITTPLHDLSGRPLTTPPTRGVYIRDGRKVAK